MNVIFIVCFLRRSTSWVKYIECGLTQALLFLYCATRSSFHFPVCIMFSALNGFIISIITKICCLFMLYFVSQSDWLRILISFTRWLIVHSLTVMRLYNFTRCFTVKKLLLKIMVEIKIKSEFKTPTTWQATERLYHFKRSKRHCFSCLINKKTPSSGYNKKQCKAFGCEDLICVT